MTDRPDPVVSCQDADALLAAWAISSVEAHEHRALRRHLAGCLACRTAAARYRSAADLLALTVDDVEPPPWLRSRVLAAVHAEASGADAPPAPGRAALPWWRALWRAVPRGRPVTAVAGVAVAWAVVVTVLAVVTRPASTPTPAATVVHACGLEAPAACGTLRYDPSAHQAVLTVTGLPAVPVVGGRPQSSYEVWLVRADHSVAPAAFLTEGPAGTTYTAAMNGDMTGVVAVATTQEAFGGGAVPHGPEVLRIDLAGQG